jgi:hypothetical protein
VSDAINAAIIENEVSLAERAPWKEYVYPYANAIEKWAVE